MPATDLNQRLALVIGPIRDAWKKLNLKIRPRDGNVLDEIEDYLHTAVDHLSERLSDPHLSTDLSPILEPVEMQKELDVCLKIDEMLIALCRKPENELAAELANSLPTAREHWQRQLAHKIPTHDFDLMDEIYAYLGSAMFTLGGRLDDRSLLTDISPKLNSVEMKNELDVCSVIGDTLILVCRETLHARASA